MIEYAARAYSRAMKLAEVLVKSRSEEEAREEAKHVADSGDFVDYSTAATLIDKYKTDAHEDQTEADAGSPGEITEVADDGNGDLANPSEQGDGEEDDPDEGGDDDTEEDYEARCRLSAAVLRLARQG